MDVTYTADTAGVSAYQSAGYKLDGIEGYLYPKTMTQPVGSVRRMRKYNPTRRRATTTPFFPRAS